MKKKYIFMALAGMAAMFTSCSDELISEQKGVEKHTGDEILFGGRAGFEANEIGGNGDQAKTRTIYTGKTYTFNGKKYEGIQWQADDKVRIYCPQANNYKTSDYTVNTTVTGVTNGNDSITGLTRINPDGALQWGNPETQHDFYAVYPAPQQHLGDNNTDTDVLNNNTTFVGVIPGIQHRDGNFTTGRYAWNDGSKTGEGTRYIAKPNMDYAYMVAKTSVMKPNEFGNNIYLHFLPIVTAVEITVSNLATNTSFPNGQDLSLANVLVGCTDGDIVYGGFQADAAQIADNLDADGKEGEDGYGDEFTGTVTAITENTDISSGSQISIPMYDGTDGIYGNPLVLHHGDAVTFTVFMLPTADHSNLRVTLQGIGGTKSAVINGAKITAKKKNYIRNLPLAGENVLPFTQAEWLKYIEDEVVLSELSIPGAGGAASGDMNEDGTYALDNVSRQQNLSINKLWDNGVRCFEFATDCTTDGNLGAQQVICNGESCDITLSEAVNYVVAELNEHPEEFAMVILTYQCLGGWNARTPATWMTKLNAYWPTVASQITTGKTPVLDVYDPAGNTGDARGKLFCIARPTSIYQDYVDSDHGYGIVEHSDRLWGLSENVETKTVANSAYSALNMPATVADGVVVINGWGPLKDKWQQRGYSGQSVRHTNSGTGDDGLGADGLPGRPFDVSTMWDHANRLVHSSFREKSITWYNKTWYGDFPYDPNYNPTPTANFTYTTSLKSGKKAWVQEWARVSKFGSGEVAENVMQNDVEDCTHVLTSGKSARAIYWDNSVGEKETHIIDALNAAIDKTKTDCSIYINSLCGYYIDASVADSYKPCSLTDYNAEKSLTLSSSGTTAGLKGNIGDFAKDMNTFFQNHLKTQTSGFVPGSMGVILMDRVGEDEASKYIPSYIVSNNFQHDTGAQAVALSMPRSDYDQQNGDTPAAKTRSHESKGGFTVTWE